VFAMALLAPALLGQVPDTPPGAGAVDDDLPLFFADCNRCDSDHLRRTITFVNHVRDPAQAEVYVLVTDQQTGSGGRQYTLAFSGRGRFQGQSFTTTHISRQSETQAQARAGLTNAVMLGLASYAAQTSARDRVALTVRALDDVPTAPPEDRWDFWTFELYGGGNFSTEATQSSWSARYGIYSDRVTEEWKVRLRPYFNHNARTIERPDRDDVQVRHRRHGFDSFVIRSLGEHWGAGLFGEYITTTIDNLRHQINVHPGIEYSVFPYTDASYRAATLTYRIGYEYTDYYEETIYETTEDSLLRHSLNASVQIRQPWGSVSSGLTGSSYLHDTNFYRVSFNGNVSLRLSEGLSVNFGGNYQRINDQLALPRGDASLEDILLERRRIATSYRGSGNISLSYTFGSIFTNVVNPRF
jgi:hypothetical protein